MDDALDLGGRMGKLLLAGLLFASLGLGACAHEPMIKGTMIPDTAENNAILQVVETYRQRMLEKDVDGLLLLASKSYSEDSATPNADDDYDYDHLSTVLRKSMTRLKSLHYEIHYKKLRYIDKDTVEVEVVRSGAFELAAESGNRYKRVSDYHRFVLERSDKGKWQFIKGL
jgi:hypothetical protein